MTNWPREPDRLNQHRTRRALWWHFTVGLAAFIAISNPFVRSSFAEQSRQPVLPFLQDGGARDSFVRGVPSLDGVKGVVISQQVVDGTVRPLYMYSGGVRAI